AARAAPRSRSSIVERGRGADVRRLHEPPGDPRRAARARSVLVASLRGSYPYLSATQRMVDRLARRLAHPTAVNAEALRVRLSAEEDPRRVRVIPNGVVESGDVVPIQDPIVGMVADFLPPRDHRTFIRAAALVAEKVPTAEFHLVGAGPEQAATR